MYSVIMRYKVSSPLDDGSCLVTAYNFGILRSGQCFSKYHRFSASCYMRFSMSKNSLQGKDV